MNKPHKRLYRSTTDRKIAGVCGGLGEYLGIDSTIIRLAWVVAALVTAVIPTLFAYIIIAIVVPVQPPKEPQ